MLQELALLLTRKQQYLSYQNKLMLQNLPITDEFLNNILSLLVLNDILPFGTLVKSGLMGFFRNHSKFLKFVLLYSHRRPFTFSTIRVKHFSMLYLQQISLNAQRFFNMNLIITHLYQTRILIYTAFFPPSVNGHTLYAMSQQVIHSVTYE